MSKSIRIPTIDGAVEYESMVGRVTISADRGICAVVGIPKGGKASQVKSYIFSEPEDWSKESAAAWVKTHGSAVDRIVNTSMGPEFITRWDNDDDAAFDWIDGAERDLDAMVNKHDASYADKGTSLEAVEFDIGSAQVTDNGDGTVKIGGLRIANLGKHTDRNGRVWDATSDVFKAIRETFAPLIERGWRVPLVWSHDLDPRDGENPLSHIALGWLQNLSQVGEWMVGELDKVPMGIYKMMRNGAWASVSPRILKGLRLGDYTAPWAIGHLSLCGARKAAMPKIRTFDELAGIYQADERPRDVNVAWECDLAFDIGTGDEAGRSNPPIDREDGTMDRAEALKALGLDEDTLKAQEAAVVELEAAKKEGKQHEENATEARKELDEFRGETRATDALEFSTGYESKLSVPNRSRVRVIHEALARFEGDLEFEEGEGKEAKTVAMTPLTAFVELASEILEAAADVVDLDEHGKKKVAVPGSAKGKGDAPVPGSDKDQDLESGALGEEVVDGNELDRQARTRAAEIIEAAHKQGDVVEFDVAYEDALEEILQRKGSEG